MFLEAFQIIANNQMPTNRWLLVGYYSPCEKEWPHIEKRVTLKIIMLWEKPAKRNIIFTSSSHLKLWEGKNPAL
jgi:hypothetical protein